MLSHIFKISDYLSVYCYDVLEQSVSFVFLDMACYVLLFICLFFTVLKSSILILCIGGCRKIQTGTSGCCHYEEELIVERRADTERQVWFRIEMELLIFSFDDYQKSITDFYYYTFFLIAWLMKICWDFVSNLIFFYDGLDDIFEFLLYKLIIY